MKKNLFSKKVKGIFVGKKARNQPFKHIINCNLALKRPRNPKNSLQKRHSCHVL
jgi:hypothetical protein